jgi:hypothetical protein
MHTAPLAPHVDMSPLGRLQASVQGLIGEQSLEQSMADPSACCDSVTGAGPSLSGTRQDPSGSAAATTKSA